MQPEPWKPGEISEEEWGERLKQGFPDDDFGEDQEEEEEVQP